MKERNKLKIKNFKLYNIISILLKFPILCKYCCEALWYIADLTMKVCSHRQRPTLHCGGQGAVYLMLIRPAYDTMLLVISDTLQSGGGSCRGVGTGIYCVHVLCVCIGDSPSLTSSVRPIMFPSRMICACERSYRTASFQKLFAFKTQKYFMKNIIKNAQISSATSKINY